MNGVTTWDGIALFGKMASRVLGITKWFSITWYI